MFLVGTHVDSVETRSDLDKVNEAVAKLLDEVEVVPNLKSSLSFFPVSNKTGKGVSLLRRRIEDVTRQLDFVHQPVSLRWLQCLDTTIQQAEKDYVSLDMVVKHASELHINSEAEVVTMLQLYHEYGILVYLSSKIFFSFPLICVKPS